jgi:hypothetical protein
LREIQTPKKRPPFSWLNIEPITGELLIERKSFSVFWSFGENSMRIYRDGRQILNRQEKVHKRGGLKIK